MTKEEIIKLFTKLEGEVVEILEVRQETDDEVFISFREYFLGPKIIKFDFFYKIIEEADGKRLQFLRDKRGFFGT